MNSKNYNTARKEWSLHLESILVPVIYKVFTRIYKESSQLAETKRGSMYSDHDIFKLLLLEVPKWDRLEMKVDKNEYTTYLNYYTSYIVSEFPTLEEVLNTIFYANAKVLVSVKGTIRPSLKINVPKAPEFLHSLFKNAAHLLKNNVQYFIKPVSYERKQKICNIIIESIQRTIKGFVNLGDLLQQLKEEEKEVVVAQTPQRQDVLQTPVRYTPSAMRETPRQPEEKIRERETPQTVYKERETPQAVYKERETPQSTHRERETPRDRNPVPTPKQERSLGISEKLRDEFF